MSINRGMDKMIWYMYTMEYYSAIKKKEIRPFAAMWMDLDSVMLSEVSQTEKETNIIRHRFIRGILKKMTQMNLFTKQSHRIMATKG